MRYEGRKHFKNRRDEPLRRVCRAMWEQGIAPGLVRDVCRVREVAGAADEAVALVAARQFGAISLTQLIQCGLSRKAVESRTRRRLLHRRFRGVYVVGHEAPMPLQREMTALLAAGPLAAISHETAAYLWGLIDDPEYDPVLTIPAGSCDRRGIETHRAPLPPEDTSTQWGIPLTSPGRTFVDLARLGRYEGTLERLVAEAEMLRLISFHELKEEATRAGRRGAALRTQLEWLTNPPKFTRSEAERRFLDLIRRAGLPEPLSNVPVDRFEVDFLWPKERLAVEVDGFAYHSDRSRFERDRARGAALVAAGLRVLHVTWRQIEQSSEAVVARVAQALMAP